MDGKISLHSRCTDCGFKKYGTINRLTESLNYT